MDFEIRKPVQSLPVPDSLGFADHFCLEVNLLISKGLLRVVGVGSYGGYLLFYIILKHSSSLIIYASQYFLCTNCSPASLPGTVIDVEKPNISEILYPQLKKKRVSTLFTNHVPSSLITACSWALL